MSDWEWYLWYTEHGFHAEAARSLGYAADRGQIPPDSDVGKQIAETYRRLVLEHATEQSAVREGLGP